MEIDHLGVMPRVDGVKPFILVDGHTSCFGLDFYPILTILNMNGSCALGRRTAHHYGKLEIQRSVMVP